MKYIIIFILSISILLSETILEIDSINKDILILKIDEKHSAIKVGKSGFVISTYDKVEYINALVVVTKIDEKYIRVKVVQKNPFKKDNLAYVKKDILIDDIVAFNLFDKSAFLIAPNKNTYYKVKSLLKKKFLSPEIVISKFGHSSIDKEDLQELAKEYLIGYVYIVYDNTIATVDAFSMKVLEKRKIQVDSTDYKRPFFAYGVETFDIIDAIKNITPFDYNEYYKQLLKD